MVHRPPKPHAHPQPLNPTTAAGQAPDGEYRPRYESAAAKNAKKGDGAQVVIGGVLTVATVLRMKVMSCHVMSCHAAATPPTAHH